jgi:hypothetical protein
MSSFSGPALNHRFSASTSSKDQRKAPRKEVGTDAWIRSGFAVRPCKIVDLSDTGVQITISTAQTVAGTFMFLLSRSGGSGRPARVKWRRGTHIGAEFL